MIWYKVPKEKIGENYFIFHFPIIVSNLSIPRFVYFRTKEWVKGEINTSVLLCIVIIIIKNK